MRCVKLKGDERGKLLTARRIASLVGGPFRAPHYSCSSAALVEELTLAIGGVLYLDEADEFSRDAIMRLVSTWRRYRDMKVRVPLLILSVKTDRLNGLLPDDAGELDLTQKEAETFCKVADAVVGRED